MAIINIDGKKIKTSNFMIANVGEYTVYDEKIWRVVSYEQKTLLRAAKILERKRTKECVVTYTDEVKLMKVVQPTGYIPV